MKARRRRPRRVGPKIGGKRNGALEEGRLTPPLVGALQAKCSHWVIKTVIGNPEFSGLEELGNKVEAWEGNPKICRKISNLCRHMNHAGSTDSGAAKTAAQRFGGYLPT